LKSKKPQSVTKHALCTAEVLNDRTVNGDAEISAISSILAYNTSREEVYIYCSDDVDHQLCTRSIYRQLAKALVCVLCIMRYENDTR